MSKLSSNDDYLKKKFIGKIPEEWDVRKLKSIAKVNRGKFSHRPRNDPAFYGGDTPFIQTGDVSNSNGRITSYSQTLNKNGLNVSKIFPKGTLCITIAANIGDVGILEFDSAFPDSIIGIQPNEKIILKEYLLYELIRKKNLLDHFSIKSTQKNINLGYLNPLPIAIPPLNEQRKIMLILENIDNLIQYTQRLIEKLQQYKTGLMQRFFFEGIGHIEFKDTGLGKIPEEWETDKLINLIVYEKGRKPEHKYEKRKDGFKPYLSTEYLRENKTNFFIDPTENEILANKNCIILVWDGANAGEFFRGCDGVISSTMVKIDLISKRLILDYLYYLCLTKEREIRRQTKGTGIPHVDKMVFENIIVQIPKLKEQQLIVDILLNIDNEIKNEKKYKKKLEIIKKGLMQVLLTGKKRVKV